MSLRTLLWLVASIVLWRLLYLLATPFRAALPPGRTFAYIRASTARQIASPEIQRRLIEEYCLRSGRKVDGWYVDAATSSKKDLFNRESGRKLLVDLRPGDALIVAKLDRLSRSYVEFANTLSTLEKRRVVLHVTDMPNGVFDPSDRISMLLIQILVAFAGYERSMIQARTREAIQTRKANGERHCRHAEWGWKWEKKAWDSRRRKWSYVKVVNQFEVDIMNKCAEMRIAGYSIDYIRQYLQYEWKVSRRPRDGKNPQHWTRSGVHRLIRLACERAANPDWTLSEPDQPEETNEP